MPGCMILVIFGTPPPLSLSRAWPGREGSELLKSASYPAGALFLSNKIGECRWCEDWRRGLYVVWMVSKRRAGMPVGKIHPHQ